MTTSVIEASSLCRVFASEDGREPVRAVDGVTFAVPPEARLVALIGPDGAGKSTLMQMICGLVGQDSGSLSVLGRTPDPDDEDFVNAVGYMPQTLGLYKDLSVMENMKLFGALRGTKPPEGMTIEAYYASLIALTGLEGFEGRPAGKLSGGMKQKLALAVPPPISRRLSRPTGCSACRRVASSARARPRSFSGARRVAPMRSIFRAFQTPRGSRSRAA